MLDLSLTEAVYGAEQAGASGRSIRQMLEGLPRGGKIAIGAAAGAMIAGGAMMESVAREDRGQRRYKVHSRQSTMRMLEQRERRSRSWRMRALRRGT